MTKLLTLITLIFPLLIFSQNNNKIEGIKFNTPCELKFTRNSGTQNNYTCINELGNHKIRQYLVAVRDLTEKLEGLNKDSSIEFKKSLLNGVIENAEENGNTAKSIIINGKKALKIESNLNVKGRQFKNTSIILIYKKKLFTINITTNKLKNSSNINLSDIIKFE